MTKRIAGPRLPIVVTEIAYSQAAIWADRQGVSLRDYTEAALDAANQRAEQQWRQDRYAEACREAEAARGIVPTRHEWDRDQQQPFVRRQRSASDNQAGRPSSQRDQNRTAPQPGSKARSGTAAAGAKRRSEDPPFDAGEDHATDLPPEDRWGPVPGEVVQPGKNKPRP